MVIVIAQGEPDQVTALTGRRRGRCKWFNVAKGWGFITPNDGGPDVFVHQSVIQMNGFRSLGDEEEVEFECKISDKGLEATLVTGCEGLECKGSHRRPMSKKKFKKVRCYNCGEFANHIASKCNMDPQPKKCHHCKAADHLIADCPAKDVKKNKKNKRQQSTQSNCITSTSDDHNDNEYQSISTSEVSTTPTTTPTVTTTTTTTITLSSSSESESNESVSSSSSVCIITNNKSPEDEDEDEVVNNCCANEINSINSKLVDSCNVNGETSEDDVSLVVMETQSTSSSISSSSSSADDHHEGKQARSDSGIVHDDEDNNCNTMSRNSNCDINNNNNLTINTSTTITTKIPVVELINEINIQHSGEIKLSTIKCKDEVDCSKSIESTPSDEIITTTINDSATT
ncbi:uncharacterized protein LOC128391037 isoform X2 [Panonychus citri]|uniref:uncharacterized protein LOC128391037 isoform X2 n=1 Tax=Panonychus citri TaxID=50023 RepID=UPI0023079158|nr:uncharacterized protein LOC128391037 isoform X2 [Panonychus citri]